MENDELLTKVVGDVLAKVQFRSEHTPVMVREILEAFFPLRVRERVRYFDGTFGRGGHFRAVNELFGDKLDAMVMDQDEDAVRVANGEFKTLVEAGRLRVERGNFSEFPERSPGSFDIMLLDLGVSSPQLDEAARGFSFYHDGPLDMRMDRDHGITAEQLVNTASEDELNRLFQELGEVRRPYRVVRAVVHDRKTKAFQTTRELASLIERVDGWRIKGVHPATQYFMALRLAVNDELGVLERGLPPLMESLNEGGRLAVLTFHSLEDRIVKNLFRNPATQGFAVNKKVIVPSQDESRQNPRARSAKLRVFQKGVQDERRRRYQSP